MIILLHIRRGISEDPILMNHNNTTDKKNIVDVKYLNRKYNDEIARNF